MTSPGNWDKEERERGRRARCIQSAKKAAMDIKKLPEWMLAGLQLTEDISVVKLIQTFERMLADICFKVENEGVVWLEDLPEVNKWWSEFKKIDEERLRKLKIAALEKLTPQEKMLLGLDKLKL